MQRFLLVLAFVAVNVHAFAQQAPLQPGEYLDSYGGVLLIKPAKGGGLPFDLRTVGGNKHVCGAEGVIGKNAQAVLKEDSETCTIVFTSKPDGIDVHPKECGRYCGARASLEGMFFRPEPGCERAAMRKTRSDFKRLYDKKAYGDARTTLEPLLTKCKKTLDLDTDGRIRNDLAITQYHLGDSAGCRKTLEPLAADAAKTDETIRGELPPSDADALIPIARATRTNLKLCQASKAK